MKIVSVTFRGLPGSRRDEEARSLVSRFGRFIASGTLLPDFRDIQFTIDDSDIGSVTQALEEKGFSDYELLDEDSDEFEYAEIEKGDLP